jgi:hypothetical protein
MRKNHIFHMLFHSPLAYIVQSSGVRLSGWSGLTRDGRSWNSGINFACRRPTGFRGKPRTSAPQPRREDGSKRPLMLEKHDDLSPLPTSQTANRQRTSPS